ncbi:hypothetical protein DevBK_19325 [Devosia sp. BK]|uniref:hypothetical protein n=1 Tax=Devosia sp. BK TaxID=2871706 RepID=UPI00293A1317|nr:hypothetical protein [Devosia sp. BK]MDV3253495.1 hypothetical protein [Devosia sp. BK]
MDKKPGDMPGATIASTLRPTVIKPAGDRRATRNAVPVPIEHAPKSSGPMKPTAIPGVQRRRLEVTVSDLARIAPLAGKDVLRRAVAILQEVVADAATERSAILWGHALQEEYGRSVSRMLELSHDPVMVKAAGYVNRMSSILAAIDLKAIAETTPGVGQYLKRLNQRIDTPDELDGARFELDQLVALMASTMEPLLSVKDAIERQIAETERLAVEIEAMSIAADYLAGRPSPRIPELARIYTDRGIGLTHTLAQIRETAALRGAQAAQPLSLIAAVQEIALVTVPGWLSSLSAMTTMLRNQRRPTPTEASELDHRLRHILQQLKS